MSLTRKIKGVFATKVLILILNFLNSVLLARILGVEGRGEYALFYTAAVIIALLFSFGIPPASGFFVPKSIQYIKKIFSKGVLLYILVVLFVLTPLLFIKGITKHLVLPGILYNHQNIVLLIVLVLVMLLNNLMLSFYNATLRFKFANIFRFGSVLLLSAIYVFLFFVAPNITVNQFIVWFAVSQILIFIVLLILFYFQHKEILFDNAYPKDLVRFSGILKWGGIAWIANVVQLLNYRVDFWFVEYFRSAHDLGIYALAASLAQLLWFLPQSVAAVLFPYISKGEPDKESITKWMVSIRVIFYIALIAAIIAAIACPYLIPFLYGKGFAPSASILSLLLIGTVPFCITTIQSSFLSGVNRVDLCLWGSLMGLVFTVILDIILVPKLGNIGAAYACIASYWATTIFSIIVFRNKFKVPLSEVFILKKDDVKLFFKQLNLK